MGIVKKIKGKLSRPDKIEHEVVDLKTGKKLKLVKVKQADGSYTLSRLEEEAQIPTELPDIEEEITTPRKHRKADSVLDDPVTEERTVRKDLVDLLDEDILKAVSIKEERDELRARVRDLESQLEEIEEHKTARKDAETRLSDLEERVISLKDEKASLEESIDRLKAERAAVEDKIRQYEKVLLNIKEKVVDFDRKIK